jgi:hypothetical protein
MSIAEQIMLGTQQQSQNWSVLSENLGRLGQQVGQQLAMREYQKQAAEALPVIQQQMQAALKDAGKGRSADAYSKLLPLLSNPAYTQNQFILPVLNTGLELTGLAAQDSYKRSLMNAQYGGRLSPSRMPTDEEMLSDDFGVTNTAVEGDGMGGGDIRVPTGQTPSKAIPGMEAKFENVSPDDANYVDLMAMQQGEAPAGQPQEIAALRPQGQLDFSLNKYIPSQQIIERTRQSFDKYSSYSEDERKDFISAIPEVGEAPEEGDEMEIYGVGIGKVIGPKAAPEPEGEEIVSKKATWTEKSGAGKTIETKPKKKPESQTKQEEAEQKTYEGWRENYSKAKLMFERNSQLRSLLEKAGGDITRLDYDIETVTNDANEQVQVANIKIEDQVIGQLETTAPEGLMSEFTAYQTITGAPSLFGKGSKWKFYKTEGKEKPSASQTAAGVAKKLSLEEIARGGAAPAAAPAAQAAPVLSEGNPFAEQAKADFETAKTVKVVQEKMAIEARRITETREAKKELEKVNQQIAKLNEPRKGVSPMMAGLKLSEAKATEKAIEWEKLNTKKKQLERLLSSR